ncbi:hypothetical protein BV898_03309 [Hypsibius exemplaris]|uniref:Thyroglobulin type-1 domain-containing protein n=1 Tax=Hypsibius exemplaris TaxID=2072580 RepID=A0A1W0X5K9_HYPEX|nr:hypothetical protein BV898_03309 [Hypsibius exemplaris]
MPFSLLFFLLIGMLPSSRGFALRLYASSPGSGDPSFPWNRGSGAMAAPERARNFATFIPPAVNEANQPSSPSPVSWSWLPKPGLMGSPSYPMSQANRRCISYETCRNLLIRYLQARVPAGNGVLSRLRPNMSKEVMASPQLRSVGNMIVVSPRGLEETLFLLYHTMDIAGGGTGKTDDSKSDSSQSSGRHRNKPVDCQQLAKLTATENTTWIPACDPKNNTLQRIQTLKSGQKFCVDIYTTGVLVGPTDGPISCECATQAKRARLRSLHAARTKAAGDSVVSYIPQCDQETGSFIATQCDLSVGQCWCVQNDGTQVGNKWTTKDFPTTETPVKHVSGTAHASTGSTCRVPDKMFG